MWRFWNCFPRVARQQFHGPRASTGVYVEEEKTEHEVEKCVSKTLHDDPEHKQCDSHSYCGQSTCDNERESGRKGRANHEQNDWWQRHCQGKFWLHFFGQHRALEAVTWGAAVVLGLQLSRQQNHFSWVELLRDRDKRQIWREFLFRVAFAMPGDIQLSTGQSVLPGPVTVKAELQPEPGSEDKGPEHNDGQPCSGSTPVTEDKKTLGDLMQEFQSSCQRYASVGSAISGVCAAEQGKMSTAVGHLQLASELGHPTAYFNLALCYQEGLGVKKDLKQAAVQYQRAAATGHAQSMYNLALLTLRGEGGLTVDKGKAMQLLKQAAELGLAQAQTYLGVYYTEDDEQQQDFEQAAALFKAAADQNDAEAQYFLGICYENGWGVESSDEEAGRLYAAAAELGHDGALYNWAAFQEYGLGGVDRDEEEAMRLYQRAADCGNENAKFKLQESAARQAVRKWSEQNHASAKPESAASIGVRRSPHSSSPSFTNFMRECIASAWKREMAASSSAHSLSTAPQASSGRNCQSIHQNQGIGYELLDLPETGNMMGGCVSGMHRVTTMPELRVVPCQ